MDENKTNNIDAFTISVNPYDVAEVHKKANTPYLLFNAANIKFDPSKSSILKFSSPSNQTVGEKDNELCQEEIATE